MVFWSVFLFTAVINSFRQIKKGPISQKHSAKIILPARESVEKAWHLLNQLRIIFIIKCLLETWVTWLYLQIWSEKSNPQIHIHIHIHIRTLWPPARFYTHCTFDQLHWSYRSIMYFNNYRLLSCICFSVYCIVIPSPYSSMIRTPLDCHKAGIIWVAVPWWKNMVKGG